jgi:hypothetical protein
VGLRDIGRGKNICQVQALGRRLANFERGTVTRAAHLEVLNLVPGRKKDRYSYSHLLHKKHLCQKQETEVTGGNSWEPIFIDAIFFTVLLSAYLSFSFKSGVFLRKRPIMGPSDNDLHNLIRADLF